MQQPEVQKTPVPKTALPVVAAILTLVSGVGRLLLIFVVLIIGLIFAAAPRVSGRVYPVFIFAFIGLFMLVTGVLAVVGGVYNLKRKNWALSLAGAIASLLPFTLLGLASIILLAMSKNEFEN
jgi:uncharacterized membrane protein HdeD (DUF308 family)